MGWPLPIQGGRAITLVIPVSPELQRRLAEEAARRGQSVEEFARGVLEERLAGPPVGPAAAWLASLPRPEPEEVQALLRAEGARPVERFEDLVGTSAEEDGDEEFDVDAFLEARRRWQWEGAPVFPASAEHPSPASEPKP